MKKIKIGLALGGGGSKGFCHIGVLKALEKYGIKVDVISGTSMGSLVGGIYSSGTSIDKLEKFVSNISLLKISDLNFFRIKKHALLKGKKVVKIINKLKSVSKIEDCPIKFISTSFDVVSNKVLYTKKGNLTEAIYESITIPGIFSPIERNGRYYVDGGVADNVPTKPLVDLGCDVIIAVDAIGKIKKEDLNKNILNTFMNFTNVLTKQSQEKSKKFADVWLEPNVGSIINFKFNKRLSKEAILQGELAVSKNIKKIRKLIKDKSNV